MSGSAEKCLSSANKCPHGGATCCGGGGFKGLGQADCSRLKGRGMEQCALHESTRANTRGITVQTDPNHTAEKARLDNTVDVLELPRQLLDLPPIKHFWKDLKMAADQQSSPSEFR